jgi:serine/threonine protein kinase
MINMSGPPYAAVDSHLYVFGTCSLHGVILKAIGATLCGTHESRADDMSALLPEECPGDPARLQAHTCCCAPCSLYSAPLCQSLLAPFLNCCQSDPLCASCAWHACFDYRLDGRQYAVKKIRLLSGGGSSSYSRIIREVATLSRLQHPNVVRYFQVRPFSGDSCDAAGPCAQTAVLRGECSELTHNNQFAICILVCVSLQ